MSVYLINDIYKREIFTKDKIGYKTYLPYFYTFI
jgi:hypothetical protein